MSSQDLEPSESSKAPPSFSRNPSYSHTSPLSDPGLSGLRDQIKNVMIPMLIKVFQCKMELDQTLSLPSRLTHSKPKESSEEIEKNLRRLDDDLNVLSLWCQSCRNQISKALRPPEEVPKDSLARGKSEKGTSHPAVSKSFSNAVSMQKTGRGKKERAAPPLSPLPPVQAPMKKGRSTLFSLFSWLSKK